MFKVKAIQPKTTTTANPTKSSELAKNVSQEPNWADYMKARKLREACFLY